MPHPNDTGDGTVSHSLLTSIRPENLMCDDVHALCHGHMAQPVAVPQLEVVALETEPGLSREEPFHS